MMSYVAVMLITGGLAAGVLGTLHHQLKPLVLSPVAAYTIGSAVCLVALSGALIWLTEDWRLVAVAWGIWVMAGSVISMTYVFDWLASEKRTREIRERLLSGKAKDRT